MASDNNLKVDELNFDSIKTNFKSYLKAQDQFRDYNFDGSGMSVLLDLLAYNTYYNSFYLNMVASEAFLPTAQKRNSVVNLAKSLNYTPRSTSASSISGTITATVTGAPSSITIPKYTEFNGKVDNSTFKFLTEDSITLYATDGYVGTVNLKEGSNLTRRYTVNIADTEQRFLIPNPNVDTTTIAVSVLNSSTDSTSRTFTQPDNLVEIQTSSLVYFLEEAEDGQFEIKFGDGIFGVALDSGNIVVIEYIVTNGADANDVLNLTYNDSITNVTTIAFRATDSSTGGSIRESISSIRFNAPKSYQAQNRVVTAEDYKTLLLKQPTVDSVIVWGGEDNDPPTYGKVYIAVKPSVGMALTSTEKNNLINTVIKPKKVLTVTTEIVDPEYIYLLVDITAKYNSDSTTLTEGSLTALIENVVTAYNSSEINSFSKYFRYSKLNRLIDFADRSILNSDLTIRMRREQDVTLNVATRYEIDFSNPIDNATDGRISTHPYAVGNKLTSNAFTYNGNENCFIEENNGIIRIYRVSSGTAIGVLNNEGSLNYTTGKVILTAFAPTAFADGTNTIKLTAVPANKDILPLRKQIIQIRDADVNVTMLDDKTISLVNR
jgi:hypothetical protein